ncbi:MAG: radical SAM protein, partial [Proteobacteria bacterium]|nr:radical SAM protein [Pseudomonadota bacterium]
MLFSLGSRIRKHLVDEKQDFTFYSAKEKEIKLPISDKTDLYIHIPFCKSMCPYCPYNRIKYDKKKVDPYVKALLNEIEIYGKRMGRVRIGSVYIGGGTPTNLIDELAVILKKIKGTFAVEGNISLETSVYDITEYNVKMLKKMGVEQISIGVQSFDDRFLRFLGRNYNTSDIVPAINRVKSAKFKSLNIDLMFALPGQRLSDVIGDLEKAVELGIDQITVYP